MSFRETALLLYAGLVTLIALLQPLGWLAWQQHRELSQVVNIDRGQMIQELQALSKRLGVIEQRKE